MYLQLSENHENCKSFPTQKVFPLESFAVNGIMGFLPGSMWYWGVYGSTYYC